MNTECAICDRPAVRFWGPAAYCRAHFEDAKRMAPTLHDCPKCGEQQGAQILWRKDAPCGKCLAAEGNSSVEAVLLRYGIHEGFPTQRRELAESLTSDDVSPADVEALGEWVNERLMPRARPPKRRAALAKILESKSERTERLTDIRAVQKAQSPAKTSDPTGPIDDADLANMVACRVDGDGKSVEFVADEFGRSVSETHGLLEKGRAMRQVHLNAVPREPDGEEHEVKLSRFRKAMAESERDGRPISEILKEMAR